MTANASPPAWYADPTGQGEARYWNGSVWTESVMRGGVVVDVAIDPNAAVVPPVAGTEVSVAIAPAAPSPPPAPVQQRRGGGGFVAGAVVVAVVVLLVVVLVVALTGGDSSDSPPADDAPPATEAPAPDDGSTDG